MMVAINQSGYEVNSCEMPTRAPRTDAAIYASLRDTIVKAHCAKDSREHPCAGTITITAKHITMQCKLCGDSRQTIV